MATAPATELVVRLPVAPESATCHKARAVALARLGRHADALAACGRALGLDPGDMGARMASGNSLYALGRHAEALAEFDRAAAACPGAALPHLGRCHALGALGRDAEARDARERAAALECRAPAGGR